MPMKRGWFAVFAWGVSLVSLDSLDRSEAIEFFFPYEDYRR